MPLMSHIHTQLTTNAVPEVENTLNTGKLNVLKSCKSIILIILQGVIIISSYPICISEGE